eukprot:g1449.t1
MNRLRAAIGLAPIGDATSSSSSPAGASTRVRREAGDDERAAARRQAEKVAKKKAEMLAEKTRQRVAESRQRRKEREEFQKQKSLAEILKGESSNTNNNNGDAKAWAQRSRSQGASEREKALQLAKAIQRKADESTKFQLSQDNTNASIVVDHSSAAFKEGSTTILTLDDSLLIDTDYDKGHGGTKNWALQGTSDANSTTHLVSSRLQERQRLKELRRRKRRVEMIKSGKGRVGHWDDDEADENEETTEDGGGGGTSQAAKMALAAKQYAMKRAKLGVQGVLDEQEKIDKAKRKAILSKYDDDEREEQLRKRQKLEIDINSMTAVDTNADLDTDIKGGNRTTSKAPSNTGNLLTTYSLGGNGESGGQPVIAQDYLTSAEVNAMLAKKRKLRKEKKKMKKNKKGKKKDKMKEKKNDKTKKKKNIKNKEGGGNEHDDEQNENKDDMLVDENDTKSESRGISIVDRLEKLATNQGNSETSNVVDKTTTPNSSSIENNNNGEGGLPVEKPSYGFGAMEYEIALRDANAAVQRKMQSDIAFVRNGGMSVEKEIVDKNSSGFVGGGLGGLASLVGVTKANGTKTENGNTNETQNANETSSTTTNTKNKMISSSLDKLLKLKSQVLNRSGSPEEISGFGLALGEQEENDEEEENEDYGMVFSATTEFRRLHANRIEEKNDERKRMERKQKAQERRRKAASFAQKKREKEAAATAVDKEEKKNHDTIMKDSTLKANDDPNRTARVPPHPKSSGTIDGNEQKEEGHNDKDEEEEEENGVSTMGGLSAALSLLRSRGELRSDQEDVVGRGRDERSKLTAPGTLKGRGKFTFKYEHRDDQGRLLTQKEAYRRMSHIFHGNMPGVKARAKAAEKEQIKTLSKKRLNYSSMVGTINRGAAGSAHLGSTGSASSYANYGDDKKGSKKGKKKKKKKVIFDF